MPDYRIPSKLYFYNSCLQKYMICLKKKLPELPADVASSWNSRLQHSGVSASLPLIPNIRLFVNFVSASYCCTFSSIIYLVKYNSLFYSILYLLLSNWKIYIWQDVHCKYNAQCSLGIGHCFIDKWRRHSHTFKSGVFEGKEPWGHEIKDSSLRSVGSKDFRPEFMS